MRTGLEPESARGGRRPRSRVLKEPSRFTKGGAERAARRAGLGIGRVTSVWARERRAEAADMASFRRCWDKYG